MCQSEVTRLRQQIELELESMQRGLNGIANGTARHVFIHQKMTRVGVCQSQLANCIGQEKAALVVCQLYVQTLEHETAQDRCV